MAATLVELLEWRESLSGCAWRPPWDHLEELRRLCHRGRVQAQGWRVDALGRSTGELQPTPAEAFFEYRLIKDLGSNHGQLVDRLSFPTWVNLRFLGDVRAVWQAALEAGDLEAPATPTGDAPRRRPCRDHIEAADNTTREVEANAQIAHDPERVPRGRRPGPRSQSRKPGPAPGTVDRYAEKDRALFPEIERLMKEGLSRSAACEKLARDDRVAGAGSSESRARRLSDRFRDRRN
jgi:hypothetical protein